MENIIPYIALALVGLGSVLIIIGTIGLVRLPDVYSRIHASGVVDTGGAALILLGLCLYSGWNLVTIKLIVIGVFLFFTSPISGHAIAQVAQSQKVDFQGADETKSKSAQTSDGEGA